MLRVIVLCCDGLYQRYLVQRVSETFDLAGVVLQVSKQPKGNLRQRFSRYRNPNTLLRYLQARALLPTYQRQAKPLLKQLFYHQQRPPEIPADIPIIQVPNINHPNAVAFVATQKPDIILVNGTNLLRQPMLDLIPYIPLGILNLHTGLSPYSRGGNCNLFMLLEKHPEWVGITIHHIDPGIDSGDIILSAQVPMQPKDNYEQIDARSFYLGIELLLLGARQLAEGQAERTTQWEAGTLFLRRTGYVYEPYHRVLVNRLLKAGLVRDYLANRSTRDAGVRLVGNPSVYEHITAYCQS